VSVNVIYVGLGVRWYAQTYLNSVNKIVINNGLLPQYIIESNSHAHHICVWRQSFLIESNGVPCTRKITPVC